MRIRVTLYWDTLPIASSTVDASAGDFERWATSDVRLDPLPELGPVGLSLYEQTYLRLRFERVDAAGRVLTR